MKNICIYADVYSFIESAAAVSIEMETEPKNIANFDHLFALASNGGKIAKAAAGCPGLWECTELRTALYRIGGTGAKIAGRDTESPRETCDFLITEMLRDALNYSETPGVAVLITGDGYGFSENPNMQRDAEILCEKGWRVKILSWETVSDPRMIKWAEENGEYIPLGEFYRNILFCPNGRPADKLDLNKRNALLHTRH